MSTGGQSGSYEAPFDVLLFFCSGNLLLTYLFSYLIFTYFCISSLPHFSCLLACAETAYVVSGLIIFTIHMDSCGRRFYLLIIWTHAIQVPQSIDTISVSVVRVHFIYQCLLDHTKYCFTIIVRLLMTFYRYLSIRVD